MSNTKKALVTGGCGFVGRNFCKHLTTLGYSVTCIDNLVSSSSLHPEEWPFHLRCYVVFKNMDCRDYFKTYREDGTHFDLVIHLAAVVEGRLMIENNPIAVAQDLSIDADFFQWVVKLEEKPTKVVYFSSSAAYPIKYQEGCFLKHKKLKEGMLNFKDDIGMPDLSYGWAKLTGEYLARLAHDKHDLDIVCYRPFSGYGPDQHETYPFPAILKRVLNKEYPIEIWSDTVRDFVHIDDVVDCVMSTMHSVKNGDAINIGSGKPISFSELAKKMCKLAKHKTTVKIARDKPIGVQYRVSNVTSLTAMGWKPKVTLRDGIVRAITYLNSLDNPQTVMSNTPAQMAAQTSSRRETNNTPMLNEEETNKYNQESQETPKQFKTIYSDVPRKEYGGTQSLHSALNIKSQSKPEHPNYQ
jgi:GDP-L-fucose synthase